MFVHRPQCVKAEHIIIKAGGIPTTLSEHDLIVAFSEFLPSTLVCVMPCVDKEFV